MLNRSHTLAATLAILSGVAVQDIHADIIVAPANPADDIVYAVINDPTTITVGDTNASRREERALVGRPGASYYNTILVFELPEVPVGYTVDTASLRLSLHSSTPATANLDVYGLGFRDDPTVLESDWGNFGQNADADLVQAALMTPETEAGATVHSDDVGNAAIASFLQAQYDAGAQAGDYVFFRLATDNIDASTSWYYVHITEYTDASKRPELTITTAIPEPASMALLGLGGLTMLTRSRRSAK